jgi:hypothetical protein
VTISITTLENLSFSQYQGAAHREDLLLSDGLDRAYQPLFAYGIGHVDFLARTQAPAIAMILCADHIEQRSGIAASCRSILTDLM